jgi:hypothetical protein
MFFRYLPSITDVWKVTIGNIFHIVDSIYICFLPLLAHRTAPRRRTLVTESHVGYSGKQIARTVSRDTNHANAFVADAIENFCPPCDHRAQEA